MKNFVAPILVLASVAVPALADEPIQQGRSVALCADSTPVCALMEDGRVREMYECQARHEQAVRILPGACWDAD